jgi:hypothetical protein
VQLKPQQVELLKSLLRRRIGEINIEIFSQQTMTPHNTDAIHDLENENDLAAETFVSLTTA